MKNKPEADRRVGADAGAAGRAGAGCGGACRSRSLNVADGTVYTYSTQAVTSDSGKQTNLHENIFTYKKEAQVRPGRRLRLDALRHQPHEQDHQDA